MTFPYERYRASPAWKVVSSAVARLEANEDLKLQTSQNYIVGHLIKTLADAGLLSQATPMKLTSEPAKASSGPRASLKPRLAAKAAG